MTKYFQCQVRHKNTFHLWTHYDLESSDYDGIMGELEDRGFDDVLEICDIEEQ